MFLKAEAQLCKVTFLLQFTGEKGFILIGGLMSLQQEKPKAIDPLDYEAVISKLGDELKEDPLRDLLLFPDNDFLVSVWDFLGGAHWSNLKGGRKKKRVYV